MNVLDQLQPLDEFNQDLQANVHPPEWTNPKPQGRYNLVVVGAGTAGLVAAAGAAGLGAKVAIVERGLMGGDCLNVGCVPSKAILAAARRAAAVRSASNFGISTNEPQVNFPEVMQRMRKLRAKISPHDSARRFTELGIDVYFGHGAFTTSNTLRVGDQELNFKKAVLATGGRAAGLPIPGLKDAGYLTNETIFSLTELPKRLVVIGGGPIGAEMAQAFARFGAEVTLVERSKHILSREESDAAELVQQALVRDGVQLLLNAEVESVETASQESVPPSADAAKKFTAPQKKVIVRQGSQEHVVIADEILVSIGRIPNVDGLGLDTIGVEFDSRKGICVNERLQTSNANVYAAGDVCSNYKFTHAADFMARVVIQNALFLGRAKVSSLIIPWCTYTDPEIAHVGVYPADAGAATGNANKLTSFTQQLSGVDRAILEGQDEGFVRVHCKQGSDRILGATVVSAHAGEMIGEITLAMKQKIGLSKIASTIHPYPTQSDAIRKLGDQFNRTKLTPLVKRLFESWLRWTR